MQKELEKPITIDFGAEGKLQFETLDKLSRWAVNEEAFWQEKFTQFNEIAKNGHYQQISRTVINNVRVPYKGMTNTLNGYKEGNLTFQHVQTQADSSSNAYINNTSFYSKGHIGRHIHNLFEDDPERALQFICGSVPAMAQNPVFIPYIVPGMIEQKLFSLGSRSSYKSARKAFDDITKEVESQKLEISNYIDDTKLFITKLGDDYNVASGKLAEKISEAEEQKKTLDNLAEEQRSSFSQAFEEQKKFFVEELQLQAPVTYWKGVSEECGTKFRYLSIAFGIACFLIGVAIFKFGTGYLANHDYTDHKNWWIVSFTIIVGGLIIWGMRMLARIMMSYLHRHVDAEARLTMVQTYLALRSEAGADTFKEHAHILLEALFRPTADGLVKDDALPLAYLDAFLRNGRQ